MRKYKVKVENAKSGEIREGVVNVRTSIEHIVAAFGKHNWLVTTYHEVFGDDSETQLSVTSA